jgi:hypothetical protein
MTALLDGREAALLALFRRMPARKQRLFVEALERMDDGQPDEEAMLEFFMETGMSRSAAYETVRRAMAAPAGGWRSSLT